ncbi:unnamed protein product [Malus baccata var. baccata]
MADGIISMLLDRMASATYEYVDGEEKLVLNINKDIEEFAGNLEAIQAVVQDAEQRQFKEASVRIWLDQLKDISFQMVDVLDKWNTDMLRQLVEKQEREGENALVPNKKKAKEVIFLHDIASKIKDLNDKLSVIDEQRKRGIQEFPERQKTPSFAVMSEVFGREKEKDILITKLLSDRIRRGLLIIPILGMGGMGKTTLAQLVYNDGKVKAYFEKRVDPFDEVKIAKSISCDSAPSSIELDRALQCMSRSIQGKRFLLVLDNVRSHNGEKWERLRAPLIQNGALGSRILVTTRKHEVVDMMRATSDMINLGELSEQYCLSIFNHMAFFDREVYEFKAFEDISNKIVEKCKGLPFAPKVLGNLMHNKRARKEWLDYEFERECLINFWMAQDYLNAKGNKDGGDIGCKMHDVVYDFVQSLTKNECSIIDVEDVGNEIEMIFKGHEQCGSSGDSRARPSQCHENLQALESDSSKHSSGDSSLFGPVLNDPACLFPTVQIQSCE